MSSGRGGCGRARTFRRENAGGGLISGSFVIETIFQIPGLGREFVNSAFNRDYTLVIGAVLLYAVMIVVLNLLVDIAQVWLNPRLKFE